MRARSVHAMHALRTAIRLLLPAWLLYAAAIPIAHPVVLAALLVANAISMTAIARAAGFGVDGRFVDGLARRGLAYFVASTAYTTLVAALIAIPCWWLWRDGTLSAALLLSAALVVSLLVLWRTWPAFVLPLLWDDAYPADEQGSWLATALRRSIAFARHMTRENDLYFSCGLPAGIALLTLAAGALALSGIATLLPDEVRVVGVVVYALISPFAHALLLNRCLRAMLASARNRREPVTVDPTDVATAETDVVLPASIAQADLDATLLCAIHSAQPGLALAALERGANPNVLPQPDQRDQRSPLMVAVTLPDLRLLRALIARGVDVDRAHAGVTPLIAATRDSHEGRPDAVTMLLANGADARRADTRGNTPLHHAARCAEPIIAALLIDASADPDAVNADGATPLAVACEGGKWSIAAFMLEHGARTDPEQAQPALFAASAVAEDDPAGVKLLLKHKARVDARGPLERTALMAASLAGNARIVEALLAGGASPDLADARGTTALMEAARSGCAAAIHALGKRKADPDRVDASARSALAIACQSRHAGEDAVRAVLALGADRALVGADGKRALEHAAAAGRWHIVALLDPTYPLPSTLSGNTADAASLHADHLRNALRFGHWNIAAEFAGVLATWPADVTGSLLLDLVDPAHATARQWLLNHGLDPDVRIDGTPLLECLAARLPDAADAFEQLVSCGASVGGSGMVARVLASAGGDRGVVRLAHRLLERGADWCGNIDTRSALHLAVAAGDEALVAALLERGANPNARDALGRTPLHHTLRLGRDVSIAIQRRLMAAAADPEIADANGETPLGLALASGDGALVHWLNWTGWALPRRPLRDTDLPAAAAAGDQDAVARLLALGLPIDATDAQGATALVRAAGIGHAAMVVDLIAAGADVAHRTHSGMHCLAAAVAARREPVVRTLLAHGIAPDMPLAGNATALLLAAAVGDVHLAMALIEAGADVNAADERGTTPLLALAQRAFEGSDTRADRATFELLLRAGARLDARNADGQDALLLQLGARAQPGVQCDAEHLLQLAGFLLDRGARSDTQDQRGVGPLHACALHGLAGCARLLKAHGAPLDLVDTFGRTAADVARLLGYPDVVAELDPVRTVVPSVRQTLRRPAGSPE